MAAVKNEHASGINRDVIHACDDLNGPQRRSRYAHAPSPAGISLVRAPQSHRPSTAVAVRFQGFAATPLREHFVIATKPKSPLLAIAPGPTRIIRSSMSLAWHGLLLERHLSSPGERTSAFIDRHVISMLSRAPSRFEYRTVSGYFVACLNRPGTTMITPVGPVPDLRLHTASEFIHCALDEEFVRGVIDELERRPAPRLKFHSGIQDKSIRRIIGLLAEELETDKPAGRLYVDSLTHALATRYLLLDCASTRPEARLSALPRRTLDRVREKIEANLESDLTLDSLAEESGYSRAHFLRMFRAATGLTPHQYVLGLRLSRAQDGLRQRDARIIDIALSGGFSSQSHMTSVFWQRSETTPAEFRRHA
jgi:AraC family transcriptional regulator